MPFGCLVSCSNRAEAPFMNILKLKNLDRINSSDDEDEVEHRKNPEAEVRLGNTHVEDGELDDDNATLESVFC